MCPITFLSRLYTRVPDFSSTLYKYQIEGYFDYVVPPLEGFWWQEGVHGIDYSRKENFEFLSLIRLPDFVTKADFDWAVEEATRK